MIEQRLLGLMEKKAACDRRGRKGRGVLKEKLGDKYLFLSKTKMGKIHPLRGKSGVELWSKKLEKTGGM